MREDDLAGQANDEDAMKIPEEFPDRQTCRVRRSSISDDNFDCLSRWHSSCPFCMTFGSLYFCRYPAAALILQWSI